MGGRVGKVVVEDDERNQITQKEKNGRQKLQNKSRSEIGRLFEKKKAKTIIILYQDRKIPIKG